MEEILASTCGGQKWQICCDRYECWSCGFKVGLGDVPVPTTLTFTLKIGELNKHIKEWKGNSDELL
jgi:hypothetical protein